MPGGNNQNSRYSSDSDSSSDSGLPAWFLNKYLDRDAATLTDEPYGPVDITGGNKWIQPINSVEMAPRSCVPSRRSPGAWRLVDFTRYGYPDVIQGWKMHIGCHPEDFRYFFAVMSRLLARKRIPHKFLTLDTVNMPCGKEQGSENGQGKSCVIYPSDPIHLREIALEVEGLIRYENAGAALECIRTGSPIRPVIRPYPGGVKADLKVGRTGFIGVRYGAFTGVLATKKYPGGKGMLYDPISKTEVPDPRNMRPYPEFASNIPSSIRALMR